MKFSDFEALAAITAPRALVRFRSPAGDFQGIVEDGRIYKASHALDFEADLLEEVGAYGEVELLAPCMPETAIGVSRNLAAWYDQTGTPRPEQPAFWLKPTASAVGPRVEVQCPHYTETVVPEAEVAVVFARDTFRVTPEEAADHLLGVTGSNDVTVIQLESPYEFANKAWDRSLPLGPAIVPYTEPLRFACAINDEVVQAAGTTDYLFSIPTLVSEVSQIRSFRAGDVMFCGAAPSIGGETMLRAADESMNRGDIMKVAVEGTGILENHFV
jgi:2-keto-4-pentenoate hydratase/2-oxohepta-3-ene-1,7-dioic acid hydratase in catechol pathway